MTICRPSFKSTAILLLALGFTPGAPALASEIDDVSTFYVTGTDAMPLLNERVENAFARALSSVNGARQGGCSLKEFVKKVSGELVSLRYYSGSFETFAARSEKVDRLMPAISESIYRDSSFSRSIIGRTYGLDPSILVSGVRIGTDKLGHFMDHGYKLYELHQGGQSIRDVLKYAIAEEEGAFGLITTGVKSYGDIASAYDGLRFWKDVAGEGPNPYFVCESGLIKKRRDFSFNEYVNYAWSEAISCSDFDSWSFANEVKRNAEEFEKKDGRRYRCPILPNVCPGLYRHYEQWLPSQDASLLISPHCPRSLDTRAQPLSK